MTSPPKPRLGRPPLPDGTARVRRTLSVNLTSEEWTALDRICKLARCTRADSVRRALAHLLAALIRVWFTGELSSKTT